MLISFEEMFATTGSTLFYGGIIGTAVSVLFALVLIPVFSSEKARINKTIESEYKEKND